MTKNQTFTITTHKIIYLPYKVAKIWLPKKQQKKFNCVLLTRQLSPNKIAREIKNKGMLTDKHAKAHTHKTGGGNVITVMQKGIQGQKKEEINFRLICKRYFKMESRTESRSVVTWG